MRIAILAACADTLQVGSRAIIRAADAVSGVEYVLPCSVAWVHRGSPNTMALVVDGIPSRKSFVALWVEYGHRMVDHSNRQTGFVKAHPFMRPAFEAAANRAVDVFVETVQEFLQSGSLGSISQAA